MHVVMSLLTKYQTNRTTFEDPAQYSDGFVHVLVAGTFVVRNGESLTVLLRDARFGSPFAREAHDGEGSLRSSKLLFDVCRKMCRDPDPAVAAREEPR